MVTFILVIAAAWLAQRLLCVRQAMAFRKQFEALRRVGGKPDRDVAVGSSKRFARRVYVALAADRSGRVTDALVLRGATVWAKAKSTPSLVGCRVRELGAGRLPAGLHPMVAEAVTQAAGFVTTADRKRTERAAVAAGD